MDTQNPFRLLTNEWSIIGCDAGARAALRRWAVAEPLLADFETPADVVARCHRRGDPRAGNELLGCLLRLADDELAARTLLQAVLPSLAARAWRWSRRNAVGLGDGGVWDDVADVDVEIITHALARIRELAGTSPPWPAQSIVEASWSRLRWGAEVARRARLDAVPLGEDHEAAIDVSDGPPAGQELGEVIVDAVRDGRLRAKDAAVIYTTRVVGITTSEIAARQGRDVRAVRCQRARAERTLVALAR